MTRWNAELDISLAGRAGVTYRIAGVPRPALFVDDPIPPFFTAEVGIVGSRLQERHVAFLLLILLDGYRQLGSKTLGGKEIPQRLRFADFLGMSERALSKWAERNISPERGRLLRWKPEKPGRETSRTGGPWWLTVTNPVPPDTPSALEFIDRQRRVAAMRRTEPSDLLKGAGHEFEVDDWGEALLLLEEAREMFHRRRWSRKDPLWFEILLSLGHAQMQLGGHDLQPDVSINIHRSVTNQRLVGPETNIILARAHHIDALVLGGQHHNKKAVRAAIQHLHHAQEILRSQSGDEAVRRYWEARSYEETCIARLNATARPKRSSAILQAAHVLEDRADEMRMRYGESLLAANQPAEAIKYIAPATASGRLSAPAWVIAERLTATAQWRAGAEKGATLNALEDVEQKARALGFDHQVRLIQRQTIRVRKRIRTPVIR